MWTCRRKKVAMWLVIIFRPHERVGVGTASQRRSDPATAEDRGPETRLQCSAGNESFRLQVAASQLPPLHAHPQKRASAQH